jgi:hypothetical protein
MRAHPEMRRAIEAAAAARRGAPRPEPAAPTHSDMAPAH